jgi:hypothetical protein
MAQVLQRQPPWGCSRAHVADDGRACLSQRNLPCAAVTAYDPATSQHTLVYDDGERESLPLAFEDWVFADGTPPPSSPHRQQQQQTAGAAAPGAHSRSTCSEHYSAGALPPQKRARTPEYLAPAGVMDAELAPAHRQGAGNTNAASQAASLFQQQVQQEQPAAQYAQLPPGLPAEAYARAGQLLQGRQGLGPAVPAHVGLQPWSPEVAGPRPPAVPVLRPPAIVPPMPARALPQELVAAGRHYRAFTAALPPPGFEIFALLPGLAVDEVRLEWTTGTMLGTAEQTSIASS